MRWEFVPIVGLMVMFVNHWQAASKHSKNPTWSNYEATWNVFNKYHIALATTMVSLLLGLLIPMK